MEEERLDLILVPLGLLVFVIYHVWLLLTILHNPRRTVIGLNAESRHQWVFSMMTVSLFLFFHLLLYFFVFDSVCVLLESLITTWGLVLVVAMVPLGLLYDDINHPVGGDLVCFLGVNCLKAKVMILMGFFMIVIKHRVDMAEGYRRRERDEGERSNT